MQRLLGQILLSSNLCKIRPVLIYPHHSSFPLIIRTMATAVLSQPVQPPTLQGPHAHDGKEGKKPKDKKDKNASSATYALEVCTPTVSAVNSS